MGTDDIHKKSKAKRTITKKRIEQKSVLIALEDTKSSKFYFEELIKDKKLSGEVLFAKHIGTNPSNVIEAIVLHLAKNKETTYEKKWAIFDRDSWSKQDVNSAIYRAKQLDICVGISNESYELWLLLHFEEIRKYTSRQNLNSKLNKYFKDYFGVDYSKSSQDVYRYIIGFQKTAILNAENLIKMHISANGAIDPEQNNPITFIHQLVKCLNSLYNNEKYCDCHPLQ